MNFGRLELNDAFLILDWLLCLCIHRGCYCLSHDLGGLRGRFDEERVCETGRSRIERTGYHSQAVSGVPVYASQVQARPLSAARWAPSG